MAGRSLQQEDDGRTGGHPPRCTANEADQQRVAVHSNTVRVAGRSSAAPGARGVAFRRWPGSCSGLRRRFVISRAGVTRHTATYSTVVKLKRKESIEL